MDIHQAGTREDRYSYAFAGADPRAWSDLDARHRFDYAVLRRVPYSGDRLLDVVEADTTFALAFMDDAAALFLRRDGRFGALADAQVYGVNAAGPARQASLGAAVMADSVVRAIAVAELEREVRESPYHAIALVRLGSLALAGGDTTQAAARLTAALANDPRVPRAHERLGLIALGRGRPREALDHFRAEKRLPGGMRAYDLRVGQAWRALGDRSRARRHFRRELERDPGNAEARAALGALESG
jgi:tetratricopeptide (TPR) repeat protein